MNAVPVFLASVFGILGVPIASACSCPTAESWWDSKSPIIFQAKVLGTDLTSQTDRGIPVVSVRYQLIERFRGSPDGITVLRTITDTGMCGVRIMAGDQWIIHTTSEGWVWMCSGSRTILPTLEGDKVLLEKLRQARDAK
ncbi:MAG: hypothetical protein JNK75_09360 [Betaproteobacteria bacterium]|nr:hypothetical protein [Betaproteobacteria bacterium]